MPSPPFADGSRSQIATTPGEAPSLLRDRPSSRRLSNQEKLLSRRIPRVVSWLAAPALLVSSAFSHGGVFPPPPPDTPPVHPTGAGYSGPSAPGPSGGGSRSPRSVATPASSPGADTAPKSPATGSNGRGPGNATGGGQARGAGSWDGCWEFIKDPELQLKRALAAANPTSDGDGGNPDSLRR